jgi:outer membrane protein OmpA-like peptidoglycan-associated protein
VIAAAAVRCDGYSAKVRAHSPNATRISAARAAVVCAALHQGVHATVVGHGDARPIASPTTQPTPRTPDRRRDAASPARALRTHLRRRRCDRE